MAYARSFILFLVFVCLVPGDGPSEQPIRHVNPGRTSSKRYRTSESGAASSSVPPPPPPKKTVANKPKTRAKSVKEMIANEFWERHRRNPYAEDQEPSLVNRPFWNRFQWTIYFDVIKVKKNLYVNVCSIDIAYMEKDPAYFGEALQMCSQLNILRIMEFNKDFDGDLVAQFSATVHLGTDAERTLTWMTNGKLLSVK